MPRILTALSQLATAPALRLADLDIGHTAQASWQILPVGLPLRHLRPVTMAYQLIVGSSGQGQSFFSHQL